MATPLAAALDFVLPAAAAHAPGGPAAGAPLPATDDERLAAASFRLFDLNAEARDALGRAQRRCCARGRAGPASVGVDLASATPFLTISGPADDSSLAPLSLESAQGFSSCRANTAVVSGKWQYEVRGRAARSQYSRSSSRSSCRFCRLAVCSVCGQVDTNQQAAVQASTTCTRPTPPQVTLRSHGILQLGWCLRDTPFTVNNGVGDAPDSYAYDGAALLHFAKGLAC